MTTQQDQAQALAWLARARDAHVPYQTNMANLCAHRLGVTPQTIRNWWSGRTKPTGLHLRELTRVLHEMKQEAEQTAG